MEVDKTVRVDYSFQSKTNVVREEVAWVTNIGNSSGRHNKYIQTNNVYQKMKRLVGRIFFNDNEAN